MGFFESIGQQIALMELSDFLDIFLVAFLVYKLMPLLRNTAAARIAKAIVGI